MIVIKATGKTDVKALRRLATDLSADEVDIAPQQLQPAMPRKGGKPTVSTLSGVVVSYQTLEALLELQPVDVEPSGEYELP
ncbi:hypothetical protein [Mesorhizobium sp. CAU 1741]|uniref:hypothetical protein n=1 Tax=Mesorhizobium sp. CAU 1741 TaxID=3140366 RepID=UPI00325A5986